jgi:hypothetical protein
VHVDAFGEAGLEAGEMLGAEVIRATLAAVAAVEGGLRFLVCTSM